MAGFIGQGAKFRMGDSADPESVEFADVLHVGDFQSPEMGPQTIDSTTHSSPGGVMEKSAALRDPGTQTISINYHPADPVHQELRAVYESGEERLYQVEDRFGLEIEQFPALIRSNRNFPVSGLMQLNITLEISGLPVTLPGSGSGSGEGEGEGEG